MMHPFQNIAEVRSDHRYLHLVLDVSLPETED